MSQDRQEPAHVRSKSALRRRRPSAKSEAAAAEAAAKREARGPHGDDRTGEWEQKPEEQALTPKAAEGRPSAKREAAAAEAAAKKPIYIDTYRSVYRGRTPPWPGDAPAHGEYGFYAAQWMALDC